LQAASIQPTNQSLQESIFFSSPKRNSKIFFPSLWCFNFFATAQSTTDKHSVSLLQALTGQCNLTQTTEARTANKGLKEMAGEVVNQTFVLLINSSGKLTVRASKPPLL
jgi:hypothetical protein